MTMNDRDALLRLAISAPQSAVAPAGLADAISAEIRATRQDRPLLRLGRLGWLPRPTPAFVAVALLLLAALAAIAFALSRPQLPAHLLSEYHGGPDRSGIMVGPGPQGVPAVIWDAVRPGPLPFTTMPLVQDGRVYVADASGTVAALDARTGTVVWEESVGAPVQGTPALVDDLLVFGNDAGAVVALRTADGSQAWTMPVSSASIAVSVLEAGGTVYVGSGDGTFAALDGASGRQRWSVDVGGPVTRGAALKDGVAYVGATGGRFSALDAETGALRWSIELGPGEVGTPVVGPDSVYVARRIHAPAAPFDIVAIDRTNPGIRWAFTAQSGRQAYPGGLANGLLYVCADDGTLTALDPASGVQRWAVRAASLQLGTLASIVGTQLYVSSSDRNVQAFDATTGAHLWTVGVSGVPTEAAVVDGSVFVGSTLGHVYAIGDTSAGSPAAAP
jgi:eukaryotic-like serine/threonine-protein kinase